MKLSTLRNIYDELNEFVNIENFIDLMKVNLGLTNTNHLDELMGAVIQEMFSVEFFKTMNFDNSKCLVLGDPKTIKYDLVKLDYTKHLSYYPKVDYRVASFDILIELFRLFIDTIVKDSKPITIDLTQEPHMWRQEIFNKLTEYIRYDYDYIVSPSVSVALQCIHQTTNIEHRVIPTYRINNSTIFIDCFATEDYMLRVVKDRCAYVRQDLSENEGVPELNVKFENNLNNEYYKVVGL